MTQIIALEREIEAAKLLRDQLADICATDPDFLRDAIEGETNIRELIAILAAEEGEDKAIIAGLETFAEGLAARKDRINARIETRRALLATALDVAGLKSLETPTGTVAITKVAPKAITTEESEIPSRFWKAAPPKLDKKALTDALKAGETIPGATLSNGSSTVTIRRN